MSVCSAAPTLHADYASEAAFLCQKETPSVPAPYILCGNVVLEDAVPYIATTMLRIITDGCLPEFMAQEEHCAAVFREALGKKYMKSWNSFVSSCFGRMPLSGVASETHISMFARMEKQLALVPSVARTVATSIQNSWTMFIKFLNEDPDVPISWLAENDLCRLLLSMCSSKPEGFTMLEHDENRAGNCMMAFLLKYMRKYSNDGEAAFRAAAKLNASIRGDHPQPLIPILPLPIGRVMQNLADMMGCRTDVLVAEIQRLGIANLASPNMCPIVLGHRVLSKAYLLRASTASLQQENAVKSLTIRSALLQAFDFAHRHADGVDLSEIVRLLARETKILGPGNRGFIERMHIIRQILQRSFTMMLARYGTWANKPWVEALSIHVSHASLGLRERDRTGNDEIAKLAQSMVTVHGSKRLVSLRPLVEHLLQLPARAITAKKPSIFGSCPVVSGVRNACEIAQRFTAPTPCKLLRICSPVMLRLMLDEQTHEDEWFSDSRWIAAGMSLRGKTRNASAKHDLSVEIAYGMPTPRLLAVRLFNRYILRKNKNVEVAFYDVAVCALIWNASTGIRSNVLQGVRSDASHPETQTCMACDYPFNSFYDKSLGLPPRPCEHALCVQCAVAAVESRIENVLIGDASVREQTGAALLKCPHPGCSETMDWTMPLVGPEYRFFLGRVQKPERPRMQHHCSVCWGSVTPDEDGHIGTCDVCECQTCLRCMSNVHPGIVCQASPGYQDPKVVLSEAKMQACPACGLSTTKDGGCNHMKCSCGAHWCWACASCITAGSDVDAVSEHYMKSTLCSTYEQKSEVTRIRQRILARSDLTEELKVAALTLLTNQFKQEYEDL